jgi:cation:H+ antiporter
VQLIETVLGLPFPVLLLAGGFLLWWGGEHAVDHAVHLARSLQVNKAVVGAVILGFGTSLPELLVSASAAFAGHPEIAVGNVVGSNVANVGLILGSAGVMGPVIVGRSVVRMHAPFGVLAAIGVLGVAWDLEISRFEGVLLLVAFGVYLALSYRGARVGADVEDEAFVPERRVGADLGWILVGLVGISVGARVFVHGAEGCAAWLGVPEEVIAVTVVALGTSLPELVTSVKAARKGHGELAAGNVAGSNVFNLLLVLGATTMLLPIPVSESLAFEHVPVAGVFSLLAFPLFGDRRSLGRAHGTALLVLYGAYLVYAYAG